MSGKNSNKLLYYLFRDLFFVSGFCLLLLLVIEDIQPGFVSFWFDFKYLLMIVVISGIVAGVASFKKNGRINN